jgi:hypothetical protein
MDPKLTHPLTPAEFHQRILVPQVGLLLIREDLDSSMKKALKTMRDSTSYGVAMFPEDGDGEEWKDGVLSEDEMGVADKIVLERARKRRKELEVEEREENEAFERQLAKDQAKVTNLIAGKKRADNGRDKGKGKEGKRKTSGKKTESDMPDIDGFGKSKRKSKASSKPPSFVAHSDREEEATKQTTRPRPKPRQVSRAASQTMDPEPAAQGAITANQKSDSTFQTKFTSAAEIHARSAKSAESSESDEFELPLPRLKSRKASSSTAEDSNAPETFTQPLKQKKLHSGDIECNTLAGGTRKSQKKKPSNPRSSQNVISKSQTPFLRSQREKKVVLDDRTPRAKTKKSTLSDFWEVDANRYPLHAAKDRKALK